MPRKFRGYGSERPAGSRKNHPAETDRDYGDDGAGPGDEERRCNELSLDDADEISDQAISCSYRYYRYYRTR